MKTRRHQRFSAAERCFSFERLETRTLLAGNVTAAVNAGELDIAGDNANNSIQVSELSPGTWLVKGIGITINNAGNSATEPGVTGNIVINLSGGNDTLKVSNGTVPGALLIDADDNPSTPQDGNDGVQVTNITTGQSTAADGTSLVINLGNGNNTAKLSDVTTDGLGQVNSGSGNNSISLHGVSFDAGYSFSGNNGVFTENGKQNISLSNVSLTENGGENGVFTGTGSANISLSHVDLEHHGGGMNGVFTGIGNSNISLSDVTLDLPSTGSNGVDTGNGNQNIKLSNVTMSLNLGENEVETGNGTQSIVLSHVQMTVVTGGDNEVSTGNGTAAINISHSQFAAGSSNQFLTGTGNTILAMSQVDMTAVVQNLIDSGSGKAAIALSSVNMITGNFSGAANLVDIAAGTATMTAVKLNMTCGGPGTNLIQSVTSHEVLVLADFTTSGGSGALNHIVTSGIAAVSITNWNSTGDARVENNGGPWAVAIADADMTDGLAINGDDEADVVSLAKVTAYSLNVSLNGGNDVLALASCTAGITTLDGGSGSNTLVRVHDSLGAQSIANF